MHKMNNFQLSKNINKNVIKEINKVKRLLDYVILNWKKPLD